MARSMSPISSRNSVPRSASRKAPFRSLTAPVNAPRTWPNSSLSISSAGIAAQLTGCERFAAAMTVVVNSACHELLAGSCLAGNEHCRAAVGQHADGLLDGSHRLARPDQSARLSIGSGTRPAPLWRQAFRPTRETVPRDQSALSGDQRRRAASPRSCSRRSHGRSAPRPAAHAVAPGCAAEPQSRPCRACEGRAAPRQLPARRAE